MTDACLDAETLAAWIDGGLSGAALEDAQSHVADCARCQTLAGTLARVSVAGPAAPERPARPWTASLTWLVPLTAAAAAVVLWVAVPHDRADRADGADRPQTAEVQRQAETRTPEAAPLDNRPQAPLGESQDARQSPTVVSSAAGGDVAKNDESKNNESKNNVARNNVARDDLTKRFEAETLKEERAAAAPAAAAVPPAAAERSEALARSAVRVAGAADLARIEIVSPDPSVRWRIARSVIEHSTNGGSSWEAVPTGIAAELTAGVAPSVSVCWVVGRGGVVLVSIDGRSWRRVAFPEMTDLSAVRATDASIASVSTADGRTFSTTDGGTTWVRSPL